MIRKLSHIGRFDYRHSQSGLSCGLTLVYIWNTNRVALNGGPVEIQANQPTSCFRDPLAAYFKGQNGGIDFYLINVHNIPDNNDYNYVSVRAAEVKSTMDWISSTINSTSNELDFVIVGDFNEAITKSHPFATITDFAISVCTSVACSYLDNILTTKSPNGATEELISGMVLSKDMMGYDRLIDFNEASDHYPLLLQLINVDND